MWVDIDDVRAELERSYRKYEEELRGEKDMNYRRTLYGMCQRFEGGITCVWNMQIS